MTKLVPVRELRDIDSVFSDTFPSLRSSLGDFTPSVNTREGKFAYHIDVDLPGVKQDDIHISVDGKLLTIKGERHSKEEVKKEDYHRIESSFRSFERSVTLPDDVDIENIHAEDKDGVLDITLPKIESTTKEIKHISIS